MRIYNAKRTEETRIRDLLITPLLDKVAHCASTISAPNEYAGDGEVCYSEFVLEQPSESRKHERGRKPTVDYTLTAFLDDEPIFLIPVEAKPMLQEEDMSQIAHYMCTMSSGNSSKTIPPLVCSVTATMFG